MPTKPLKCMYCTAEDHLSCYSDGVCECPCETNRKKRMSGRKKRKDLVTDSGYAKGKDFAGNRGGNEIAF